MSETLGEHPDILRVVSPAQVLRNFGVVLKGHKNSSFNASGTADSMVSKEEHALANKVWQAGRVSGEVDVFMSHVWGVPRWIKTLGLYYYLNVDIALAAALTIWFVLLVWLVSQNGLTGMGGKKIFGACAGIHPDSNLLVSIVLSTPFETSIAPLAGQTMHPSDEQTLENVGDEIHAGDCPL